LENLNSIVQNRRFYFFGWIGLVRASGDCPGGAIFFTCLNLAGPRASCSNRKTAAVDRLPGGAMLSISSRPQFGFFTALRCVMCAEYSAEGMTFYAKRKQTFSNLERFVFLSARVNSLSRLRRKSCFSSGKQRHF
jgi:hypothetical protein